MSKIIQVPLITLFLMGVCVLASFGQVTVKVDYLKVPMTDRNPFTENMKSIVRKINEQRLANGKIFAWYHYEVRFPLGNSSRHSDVVVTVFTNPTELSKPDVSAGFQKYVKESSRFEPVADARSEGYGGGTIYTHITVSTLVGDGKSAKTIENLVKKLKPKLGKRIAEDSLVNWSLFKENIGKANSGTGAQRYALVARYNGFDDLEKGLIDHSLGTFLKNEEAWKLLDIVEPKRKE